MDLDYIEAGKGETVILLHSTVAGNKQWRQLIEVLSQNFHVFAPNLIGYGRNKKWSSKLPQTLKDQAEIIRPLIPSDGTTFSLVGHSFGGSVAMMVGKIFHKNLRKLILIEPNPNYLLKEMGRCADFNEVAAIRDCIKFNGLNNTWDLAAAVFTNYFNGIGTWDAMDDSRRQKFIQALKPNFYEWDAVMNEKTTIEDWERCLPKDTTVLSCKNTLNSSRSIVKVLCSHMANWDFIEYREGGHMAPLTKPHIVNPIIEGILLA